MDRKKVLLIMTDFYNYYKDIINAIEKEGFDVDWILDRIDLTIYDRIKLKFNKKLLNGLIDKQFKMKLKSFENNKYEKIILIFGGKFIKKEQVKYLKSIFPKAEYIYYSWDSIKYFKDIIDYLPYFDRVYSFDNLDCLKYNMEFLPLFYTYDFNKKSNLTDKIYDFSSCMSFYKEKANDYSMIINSLPPNLTNYQFLYMRDLLSYYYNKIINWKYFKNYNKKMFSFKSMSRDDVNDLILKSKVVIDCPLHDQNGLTIRTFDVLRCNVKIITTNKNIINYDFYCKDNIFIINNVKDKVPLDFFSTSFNTQYELSDKYSVQNFVKKLLFN